MAYTDHVAKAVASYLTIAKVALIITAQANHAIG